MDKGGLIGFSRQVPGYSGFIPYVLMIISPGGSDCDLGFFGSKLVFYISSPEINIHYDSPKLENLVYKNFHK